LITAAKQLNCDASVQAMVAFPDVLRLLTQNVRWTTDLGNAFLAQQAGVMDAIQRLRGEAQQSGHLASTPGQVVTTQPGPVQNAIAIQPADPQLIRVPSYNPNYVWGPPAEGEYPRLSYPAESSGFDVGSAIAIGSFFTGLLNWSGWGWGLSWLTHSLFLNAPFFNQFGFPSFGGGYEGASGFTAWAHNPAHRLGVAYSNSAVAGRFGSGDRGSRRFPGYAGNRAEAPFGNGWRSVGSSPVRGSAPSEGWRFFGAHGGSENGYRGQYRGGSPANRGYAGSAGNMPPSGFRASARQMAFAGEARGSHTPDASYRGFSYPNSNRQGRSYEPPRRAQDFSRGYTRPQRSGGGHFSMPKSSGRFKAPKFSSHSSGRSSKGHSGGRSKGRHRR
jgi:hypothetical protein